MSTAKNVTAADINTIKTNKNTVLEENINAFSNVLTATVGRALLRKLLGEKYSIATAVALASGTAIVADRADPQTEHSRFLRMISRGLCMGVTSDLIDLGSKVITPNGDIVDAGVHNETMNELESAFNTLKEDFESVTSDRFSKQGERVLTATVQEEEKPAEDKAVVVEKGTGKKNPVHVPVDHLICDMCHMPGKKNKGLTLELKHPEIMPKEVQDLDGKWLCARCIGKVNAMIAEAIKAKEKEMEEIKAKQIADEAKAAEEKKNMEQLIALRVQEEELNKKIESLEKAAAIIDDETIKATTESRLEELRTSLGGVRMLIGNLEAKMTGTAALPAPKEMHTVVKPAVTVKMTRAQRRAAAKLAKKK